MPANHNPEDAQDSPNMIDRVAAAVARSLDSGSEPDAPEALTERPTPERDALIAAARSWSAYLDELAACAWLGTDVGSELPEVPLDAVLAGLRDAH